MVDHVYIEWCLGADGLKQKNHFIMTADSRHSFSILEGHSTMERRASDGAESKSAATTEA